MIGTVWETTRYGIRARSAARKRAIITASATPRAVPTTNASNATRNEYQVAMTTTWSTESGLPRTSGSVSRLNMSQT